MTTFQPFEVVPRPGLGMFGGLPAAPPGFVLVVDREGRPPRLLKDHTDRLTAGETRFGRIRTLYRVNIAETLLSHDALLPCRNGNGSFLAHLELLVRVSDPEAVVQRQIQDVHALLLPPVLESARQVTTRYEAEDRSEAEDEVLATLRKAEAASPYDAAFTIDRFSLQLKLDARAEAFVMGLKDDDRTGIRQSSQAELERQKQKFEGEAARQAEEYKLQVETIRLENELKLAHIRTQLQKQEAEMELEIRKLKIDQYLALLKMGEFGILAAQLLENPAAIHRMAALAAEQRSAEMDQQLRVLKVLLDNDAVEGWDVSDQAKSVLNQFVETWSASARQSRVGAWGSLGAVDGNLSGDAPAIEAEPVVIQAEATSLENEGTHAADAADADDDDGGAAPSGDGT